MAENLSMTKNNKTDELEFQCPLCGQELVAGLDLAGQEIFCPGCEQVINIPEPQPPDLPPPPGPPTNQANQATVLAIPLPPKPPEGAAVPPPIPSSAAAPAAPAPAEGGPKKLSLKIKK